MLSIGLGLEDSAAVYSSPKTFCRHNNQKENYFYSCVQRTGGRPVYKEREDGCTPSELTAAEQHRPVGLIG